MDLAFRHPGIFFPSEEIDLGIVGHEIAASGATALSAREIKKRIESGRTMSLAETPFSGTFRGIAIKGYPDYIAIEGGKARLLLDFKFSKYQRVFASQRIQIDIYGYLLAKNGLDTDGLICGIVIISPELSWEDTTDLVVKDAKKVASDMRRKKLDKVYLEGDPDIYGELYAFSLVTAKNNLDWAMGYWTQKRPPKPTTRVYKCAACSFNAAGKCRSALAPPRRRRQ
ncbi:hypothetical protein IMZ48_00845 [Candidatus Bathyarchaeota archaeon]|nr:hypothetical protein [Candidatus Bathyarchaeota archaeon]